MHTYYKHHTTNCSACFTTEQWLCISHGRKQYELSNHLGNVLATITDKLIGIDTNNNQLIDYYSADLATQQSYYPFGMIMPGRSYSAATYNFGFNGQIKDDEISGTGNLMTAQFWEYDTRLGIRWNIDPLAQKFTGWSPYNAMEDEPINKTDPTGANTKSVHLDDKGNVLRNYNDGDNSVYVHKTGTSATDVDKRYINTMTSSNLKNTSARGTKIGELGKTIDVNEVLSNILSANKSEIKSSWGGMTPIDWYIRVKKDGAWDYKDNTKTIFGVAWSFDEAQNKVTGKDSHTNFLYKDFSYNGSFNAADVGNYNAGYTGTLVGLYKIVQELGAGYVERNKNGASFDPSAYFHPPYGDRIADYFWNTKGMNDAQNEIANEPKPIFFK